jgi:drug/metabolite transporter (DMT)-like permease
VHVTHAHSHDIRMIGAVAAAVIWSGSSMASARGSRHLGGVSANLLRLLMSLPLLCLAVWIAGTSPLTAIASPGGRWFVWSGVVGMGLCDILMMQAFARSGVRLPSLIVNAVSAPTAAVLGWWWQGEALHAGEVGCIAVIAVAMALVLHPRRGDRPDLAGVLLASSAALAFGGAAVLSRVGYQEAIAAGAPIHWLDATLLRVATGIGFSLLAFVALSGPGRAVRDGPGRWRQALPWLALNAALGPTLGLSCYQWGLATAPAGIVQAIVSTTPALILVILWLHGSERPDRWSVLGTGLGVAGVAGLGILST